MGSVVKAGIAAAIMALAVVLGVRWSGDESMSKSSQVDAGGESSTVSKLQRVDAREAKTLPASVEPHERIAVSSQPSSLEARAVIEQPVAPVASKSPAQAFGELLLVDESGLERWGLSGDAWFELWTAGESERERLEIVNGRFEFDASIVQKLRMSLGSLDGQPAYPEKKSDTIEVGPEPIVIRVVRPTKIRLNVVDALTDQHLDEVAIFEMSTSNGRRVILESPGLERSGNARQSPIELEAQFAESGRAAVRFNVQRAGYAWTQTEIDFRRSGEHTLRLERGAHLDVELRGALPRGGGGTLRIYRQHSGEPLSKLEQLEASQPIAEQFVGLDSQHEFVDFPSGVFRAHVEIGAHSAAPKSVGQASVELVPGGRHSVTIELESLAQAQLAGLAGEVRVPPEWGVQDFYVYAAFKGTPLEGGGRTHNVLESSKLWRIDESTGSYRFDFGKLQTGKYEVGVGLKGGPRVIRKQLGIELSSTGIDDLLLEIAPPASVIVNVMDKSTGLPVKGQLLWGGSGLNTGLQSLEQVDRAQGADEFEFRAPEGEIRVIMRSAEHVTLYEELVIDPGANRFTFPLERLCRVHLVLRDGEELLTWDEDWRFDVEHLDGPARMPSMSSDSIELREPGRYRLSGLKIDGFGPVEAVEFTAMRGETIEQVIEVTRP